MDEPTRYKPQLTRDTSRAIREVSATIRRHLVDCPPGEPVEQLTDAHVDNLARHLVMLLEEYGR